MASLWKSEFTATTWQKVTVPAGTFDALHIGKHVGGGRWGTYEEYWYAPAVRSWVRWKSSNGGVDDLTEFRQGS